MKENAQMKWMKLWEKVGKRILKLPVEQQEIVLADFETAINSRLMVFERLIQKN